MDARTEDKSQLLTLADATAGEPLSALKDQRRPYFEVVNLELLAILDHLPHGLQVLDVGCGSGRHGAEFARLFGHRVTGVDLSLAAIRVARTRVEAAYIADITKPWEYPFAGGPGFDLIVFSDILEHVYDPLGVLKAHLALLKPGGRILISLPNIAIWNVRLELFFGRFEYQDTGTLDRTHIRFFNRRNFRQLLRSAGLRQERTRITPGVVRPLVPLIKWLYTRQGNAVSSGTLMESGPYRFYCKALYPLERMACCLWPGLLAFQFVALCQPERESGPE